MTAVWEPSGAWMRRFRTALRDAFADADVELLTSDYFHPDVFSSIAPPGPGQTFEFRLQALINQARMNDWLPDLVAAAHERRPRDRALGEIAGELGLTVTGGPRVDNPTGRPLEEVVRENARFIDPEAFRERLATVESQVCWVDVPGGGGTGFLVGPDLVLTNQHVVERISTGLARAADVRCRFDVRRPADGRDLQVLTPTEVGLADAWLVDARPPSRFDWDPTLGDAAPGETDSALVRLAEPVGELPVGPTSEPTAPARGWVATAGDPPPLSAGNQVFLLQHPRGEPLQLSIGTVTQFNGAGTRVRYDANSRDGSSGAPCFDADLELVALHHARDPAFPPAWNQAIPLGVIQKVWREHGVDVGGG